MAPTAAETREPAGESTQVKPLIVALACVAIGFIAAARAQEAAVKAAEAFIKKYDTNGDYWRDRSRSSRTPRPSRRPTRTATAASRSGTSSIKSAATGDPMMMMSPENRQLYRYQGFGTIAVYDRNKDGVFDEEEMKLLLIVSMDYDEDKVLHADGDQEVAHASRPHVRRRLVPEGREVVRHEWRRRHRSFRDARARGGHRARSTRTRTARSRSRSWRRRRSGPSAATSRSFPEMSDLIGQKTKVDRANWLGDPDLFRRLDDDKDGVHLRHGVRPLRARDQVRAFPLHRLRDAARPRRRSEGVAPRVPGPGVDVSPHGSEPRRLRDERGSLDRLQRATRTIAIALIAALAVISACRRYLPNLVSPYKYEEDSRQHVWWTYRFADPALFPDDIAADYFSKFTFAPLGYQLLAKTFVPFVDAQTFTDAVPFAITGIIVLLAFRLGRTVSGGSWLGGTVRRGLRD